MRLAMSRHHVFFNLFNIPKTLLGMVYIFYPRGICSARETRDLPKELNTEMSLLKLGWLPCHEVSTTLTLLGILRRTHNLIYPGLLFSRGRDEGSQS
jgi:hypothetical protein